MEFVVGLVLGLLALFGLSRIRSRRESGARIDYERAMRKRIDDAYSGRAREVLEDAERRAAELGVADNPTAKKRLLLKRMRERLRDAERGGE